MVVCWLTNVIIRVHTYDRNMLMSCVDFYVINSSLEIYSLTSDDDVFMNSIKKKTKIV